MAQGLTITKREPLASGSALSITKREPLIPPTLPTGATVGMLPPSRMDDEPTAPVRPAPMQAFGVSGPATVTTPPPQPSVRPPVAARGTGLDVGKSEERAERAVRAPAAGLYRGLTAGMWGGIRSAADLLGLESVADYAGKVTESAQAATAAIRGPEVTGAGPLEQAVYSGLESAGLAAPALAVGMASGSPAASLAMMGVQSGGEAYHEAREKGVTPLKATGYAATEGLIEALTEKIPASRLLEDLAKKTGAVEMIMRQLVAEIPGEQVATLGQDLNEWTALNPDKTLSEFAAERPGAAAQTFVATIVGTITQTGGAAIATGPIAEAAERAGTAVQQEVASRRVEPVRPSPGILPDEIEARLNTPPLVEESAPLTITAREPLPEAPAAPAAVPSPAPGVPSTTDAAAVSTVEPPGGVRAVTEGQRGGEVDRQPLEAQTIARADEREEGEGTGPAGRASLDRIAPSQPAHGVESDSQRDRRRGTHYKAVFDRVVRDAQAVDPLVSRRTLRKEFDDRIALIDELDAEFRDSGHNPRELLEAIATHGGISVDAEQGGGLTGEMRWLRESTATGPYGNFGGVPNVFRKRRNTEAANTRTGLGLDEMATRLQQDARFSHIAGPNELLEALEDVSRMGDVGGKGAVYPGSDELATRAGIKPGDAWWKESWRAEAQPTEPEPLTAESYHKAFGGTKEQADAVLKIYGAMGIPMDRVRVAKGGEPGDLAQQTSDRPRLTVLHNIHVDGLIHADKMGGLAVPSLGVVREGDVYSGMGNITLIGRPHLGDPKIEPIYDADVWSQTFPRPEYRKAKAKDVQPVVDELKPFAQTFEKTRRAVDTLWDNAVNSANPQDTISSLLRSNATKAWFLSTQGVSVEPVIRDVRLDLPWVQYLDYERFREVVPFNDERTSEERERALRDVVPILREAVDRYLTESKDGQAIAKLAKKAQRKAYVGDEQAEARWRVATMWGIDGGWVNDPTGEMPMSLDWKIPDAHNKLGKREVDEGDTETRLNEALKGREAAFKAWLEEKVLGLHPPPHVTVGRTKRPYTLAHIVDAMVGRVRAVQKHLTFGEGQARAAAAKKFTDLEQMRLWADANIRPDEDIDAGREQAKEALSAWRDQAVQYYAGYGSNEFGRVWEGLDASMRALARWAKGRKDADAMLNALSREGFSRVPIDVARDGVRAGMLWLKAPVPYFEAKPQRAVLLNEFAGAAIPDNAGPEVKAILDKHGIRYREYDDSGKDTDPEFQKAESIRALEEELEREGVKVLFEGPRGSVEFTEHGHAVIRALQNPNVSTGVHETAHVARRFMFDRSLPIEVREGVTDEDILTAEEWAGAADGQWNRDAEEKFARGFERYLADGQAPTPSLQSLFDKFARWLTKIYKAIQGSAIDVDISPAMREVFDRLVTRTERLQTAEAIGDDSFDVEALESDLDTLYQSDTPKSDLLDTGEEQPRLPGAEDVREQEIATPEFEAPFALTGEVSKATKGRQDTLFQSEGPEKKGKRVTLEMLATVASKRKLTIDAVRRVAEQAGYAVIETGPQPVSTDTGRDVPPQKPIPADRLHEFPSIQKMPEAVRPDIEALLEKYAGFEPQRRGVQSWDRTTEMAKDVWLPLETLRPGRALNAEELRAYQMAIATVLTKRKPLLEKIRDAQATDREKVEASHLTDVATALTASYRGAKAEAGRALNILRAKARVLELRESAFLDKVLDAPGFGKDLAALSREALEAAGDPVKQLRLLRRRAGTWFDRVQAFYYANLLSGIKTHERNIIGNSFNVLANMLTPLGAVPADVIRSARTGAPRSVRLGEIPHAVAGSFIGVDQGIKNALFTFKEGFRPSTVRAAAEGAFDTPRYELPGGLQNPFNYPGRLLESADEFFRAIAWHQELYAGLYAHVRQEGLTDRRGIADRMAAILSATDPSTSEAKLYQRLVTAADAFAARAVFQEEPGAITNWLLKAKAPTAPLPLRAAATFLAPFVKTPAAILRQGAEWSPAGFVMRNVREGTGRTQAQALGRAALGSAFLLGPIAWLAATGRLTGAPPDDEGEREEFYAMGKLANAVKIGPYWVRYVLFQPYSVGMAAIANAWERFADSEQDQAAAEESFIAAVAGAGQALFDQSFMLGVSRFIDAINDPSRYAGRWLSMFAQGWVPFSGMARNVTQAVDPVYRRPQGVPESIQAIIPGASEGLPPRRTRFGEQVTAPGPWWQRGFVVPEVSKEASDLLTRTLAEVGYRPTLPDTRLTLRGKEIPLSADQKDVLAAALGQEKKWMIERQVRGRGFTDRPDEVQREILERVSAVASRAVRERAMRAAVRKEPLVFDRLVSTGVRTALAADREAVLGPAGKGAEAQRVVAR